MGQAHRMYNRSQPVARIGRLLTADACRTRTASRLSVVYLQLQKLRNRSSEGSLSSVRRTTEVRQEDRSLYSSQADPSKPTGFWDFTADLKHGDLAYSDVLLQGHTDTTYFTDVSHGSDSHRSGADVSSRSSLFTAVRSPTLPPSLTLILPHRRPQPPCRRFPRRRRVPSSPPNILLPLLFSSNPFTRLRNRFRFNTIRSSHDSFE